MHNDSFMAVATLKERKDQPPKKSVNGQLPDNESLFMNILVQMQAVIR